MSRNHVAQTVAELPFLGAERFGGVPRSGSSAVAPGRI
jgi:hypothetical protein